VGPVKASEKWHSLKKKNVYILNDGSEIPNNHLGCRKKTVVNEGILRPYQLVIAEFLNHQQYPLDV